MRGVWYMSPRKENQNITVDVYYVAAVDRLLNHEIFAISTYVCSCKFEVSGYSYTEYSCLSHLAKGPGGFYFIF